MSSSHERRLTLRVLPDALAICRLAAAEPPPAWLFHDGPRFFSLTRTPNETSVVCAEEDVPPSIARVERGWRALAVDGPLPLEATGILASLATPLAAAGIPVFVISTHDTDYLLVRAADLSRAIAVLRELFTVTP